MRIRSFQMDQIHLFSLICAVAALVFSHSAMSKDRYLTNALNQQIPGITSCSSCHSSGSARWPGVTSAFKSGGSQAVSRCLANNTCGPNASNSVATGSTLSSKIITASIGSAISGSAATNVYKVNCPKKTVKLAVSVNDQAPINDGIVTIQAIKNFSTSIASDPIDGDDVYGPTAEIERGPGLYTILVSKQFSATPGAEVFSAKLECLGKPKVVSRGDDDDDDEDDD